LPRALKPGGRETPEPKITPRRTSLCNSTLVKLSPPMNGDIVNPIPAGSDRPWSWTRSTPSGILAGPPLIAA
jgi:hypothetical protein